MADFLNLNDCTLGIGTTVAQLCDFKLGDVRILNIIDVNAANPFTGADQAAQEDNMQDQLVWTDSQALAAPDNLYVSPSISSSTMPRAYNDYAQFGSNNTETLSAAGVQYGTFIFRGIIPEAAIQLRKLENRVVRFQFVNKVGGLWYKAIANGTDYPFFTSSGPCRVSSVEWADRTKHDVELTIPLAIDWFDSIMATTAAPNPLDVTAITEVQQRLIEIS